VGESPNCSFDADLNGPPDGVPVHPAVTTRAQVLPFGELTWENFERLCYRLAGKAQGVEYVARYGRSGQAQQGIDLYARLGNGKYEVWQAKRYGSIAARNVKAIVAAFWAGAWKDKSDRLVLAVQASLADTKVQNEVEKQADALKAEGITFVAYGGDELSEVLRAKPVLVDDFFGRGWVEAFLGPEAAKALSARLDGGEFRGCERSYAAFMTLTFICWMLGLPCRSPRMKEHGTHRRRCFTASRFLMFLFGTP